MRVRLNLVEKSWRKSRDFPFLLFDIHEMKFQQISSKKEILLSTYNFRNLANISRKLQNVKSISCKKCVCVCVCVCV